MNVRSALVTGGAGFIGSHIVDALLDAGVRVCVVDNFSTGHLRNLGGRLEDPRLQIIDADVRDLDSTAEIPDGIDVVFHEAAIASVPRSVEDPVLVNDVNFRGALEVMEFCRKRDVMRLVFASSAAVYGVVAQPPATERQLCSPSSPYGASKLAAEEYLHAYHCTYGLETVALRYFNVYGPRQRMDDNYSGVIPLFSRQLLSSVRPVIYGDGLQTRDFVYVTDVATANLLAARANGVAGQVFNVASGRQVSILELFKALRSLTGSHSVEPGFSPARVGDLRVGASSIEKIGKTIGYKPEIALEVGLSRVLGYVGGSIGREVAAE